MDIGQYGLLTKIPILNIDLLDGANLKLLLDLAMIPVAALLFGLFIQAATRTSAMWYVILEKFIGIAFVGVAASLVFFLPFTWEAVKIYAFWYISQVLLFAFVPGKKYFGLPLREAGGQRLQYKCNGLVIFALTMAFWFYGGYAGWFKYSILADNFLPLLAVTNVFSFLFAAYLYVKGLTSDKKVTRNNIAEDFWYGLELNPVRLDSWGLDLKFFSESRPGLTWWVLINFSIAAKQYAKIGYVTTPMLLVSIFHFIYIFDYFLLEEYIVTTWDIFQERFGFMLLWGDYVWVPYYYIIPSWYLYYLTDAVAPSEYAAAIAAGKIGYNSIYYNIFNILVFGFGYFLFRGANRQKHKFRENPNKLIWGEEPKVIQTKAGSRLLISGFWGWARHINYLGDLVLAISWGMPCGFGSYIPYLYFFFMVGLLLHRFARDDERCAEKYGEDWDRYCKAVPSKLIPYVF